MARKASPKLVGFFVVTAILLASAAVLLFGSGRIFSDTQEFIVFFRAGVAGLSAGAPVKFRGVEVGGVKSIRLSIGDPSMQGDDFRMPVIIELDQRKLTRRGAEQIDVRDPATHQEWIDLGMRAKLSMESFVTGRKYVELDIMPDTPADMVNDPTVPYPELPTAAGGIGELQAEAAGILANIAQLDLDSLVTAMTTAFVSFDRLVSSEDLSQAGGALPGAIAAIQETLEELGDLRMMDVILPTRDRIDIRKRCLSKPTDHQQILLDHLRFRLPKKRSRRLQKRQLTNLPRHKSVFTGWF